MANHKAFFDFIGYNPPPSIIPTRHHRDLNFQPESMGFKAHVSQHDCFLSRVIFRSPVPEKKVEAIITTYQGGDARQSKDARQGEDSIINVIPLEVKTVGDHQEIDLGLFPRHRLAFGGFVLRVRTEEMPAAFLEYYFNDGTLDPYELFMTRLGGRVIAFREGSLEVEP